MTRILEDLRNESPGARDALLRAVYVELKQIAAKRLRGERSDHTLQPTALVHEAYLSLLGERGGDFRDRSHFFAAAAKVMRQILVDRARSHKALKRGGGRVRVTWKEGAAADWRPTSEEIVAVHDALERLEAVDPVRAQVVELRFFAGLTVAEAASVLGLSERSVYAKWEYARTWLFRELAE